MHTPAVMKNYKKIASIFLRNDGVADNIHVLWAVTDIKLVIAPTFKSHFSIFAEGKNEFTSLVIHVTVD